MNAIIMLVANSARCLDWVSHWVINKNFILNVATQTFVELGLFLILVQLVASSPGFPRTFILNVYATVWDIQLGVLNQGSFIVFFFYRLLGLRSSNYSGNRFHVRKKDWQKGIQVVLNLQAQLTPKVLSLSETFVN